MAFLSRGLVKLRGKLKKISTIIMSMATKVDRMMTNHKGFPIIMPHDPSFTWPWQMVKTISSLSFMTTKLGIGLTSRRRFKTQTRKSSRTSCFILIIPILLLLKGLFYYFTICKCINTTVHRDNTTAQVTLV